MTSKISLAIAVITISAFGFIQPALAGKASYYGDKFVGRSTASGEKYSHGKMTAAHRSYKFGTKVKVTNLKNGKSVIVRINDRGPFSKGRVIDLSKGAAQKINMIKSGVVPVSIQIVK